MESIVTERQSATKLILMTGIILGVLNVAGIMTQFYSGLMEQGKTWPGWIYFAVQTIITVMLIKNLRDTRCNGYITFGRSFGISVWSFVIGGVIETIFAFLFFRVMHPEVIGKIMQNTEAKLVAQGLPDEQIAMSMKVSHMVAENPAITTVVHMLMAVISGCVAGVIAGAICKKEPAGFPIA